MCTHGFALPLLLLAGFAGACALPVAEAGMNIIK
jgi:hypothetical protein